MKRFLFCLLAVCFVMLGCLYPLPVSAQEAAGDAADVFITADVPTTIYNKKFIIPLTVHFPNQELYSEHLKLAYHVLDSSGNMLVMETPRIPLAGLTNGSVALGLEVDLSANKDLRPYKQLVIQLDIVDEANSYWMQGNTAISFSAPVFYYQKDFGKQMLYTNIQAVRDYPIIAVINVLIFVLFFVGIWRVRKMLVNLGHK